MHKKSFTLLEVLFVLCIASISLFFLVNTFSRMASALSTIKNYTKAMFLTEEEFFNISQKNLDSYKGQEHLIGEGFSVKEQISKIGNDDIFSVAIHILWGQGKIKKKFSTLSYVREKK